MIILVDVIFGTMGLIVFGVIVFWLTKLASYGNEVSKNEHPVSPPQKEKKDVDHLS